MSSAQDRFWHAMYAAYDDDDTEKVAQFIEALGGLGKAATAWGEWKASRIDWSKGTVDPHQLHGLASLLGEIVTPPPPPSWRGHDSTFFTKPGVLH